MPTKADRRKLGRRIRRGKILVIRQKGVNGDCPYFSGSVRP